MSGWYLMHRGWQEHAVFKDEPYTEREAWEWLISEATYENRVINIMNNPVTLKRGQVSHSIRFLSEKWGWSKSKTETFLEKLKKWDMVQTQNRTGQNIITICNYEQYQTMQTENRTASSEKVGQSSDSHRTKKNSDNKDNEVNTPKAPKGVSVPDWIPEQAWQDYCTHRGSKFSPKAQALAISKLERWRADGHDPGEILNESVMNGWKGLFEPKGKKNEITGRNNKYDPSAALALALSDQTYAHLRSGGSDYIPPAPALPKPPN